MELMTAAAVCYHLFSAFFLVLALEPRLEHCGVDPHCPAEPTAAAGTMISVQHDPADGGSLSLSSTTPRPVLREGELLVKVYTFTCSAS